MKTIKAGIELICGCCGSYFETWEGYIDQDQDDGYGICKRCQVWSDARGMSETNRLEKQGIELFKKNLTGKNLEHFLTRTEADQRAFVRKAIKDGVLTFGFGPGQKGTSL